MVSTSRILSLLLIPTAVLVGGGGKKADTAAADSAASGTASSDETSKPTTVEDIARWEKGMEAEMQRYHGHVGGDRTRNGFGWRAGRASSGRRTLSWSRRA